MRPAEPIMNCRLCNAADLQTAYEGPIRSGGADSGFEDGFAVRACAQCGVEFLDPFPSQLDQYYATPAYWTAHHGQVDVATLQRKHQPEQLRWLQEIGLDVLRSRRVADFGCGPGLFLDLVRNVAAETVGIDPALHFHDHLESNGHRHVARLHDLEPASVDVAVSFDTLEHLPDPAEVLSTLRRALRDDGIAMIGVPNQQDFLKRIVPDYLPFFYHRSHLFYFSADAMVRVLERAGFGHCEVSYVHKYDLMNMVVWARDGMGQGTQGSDLFDRSTEDAFRTNLERQGIASHLLVRART